MRWRRSFSVAAALVAVAAGSAVAAPADTVSDARAPAASGAADLRELGRGSQPRSATNAAGDAAMVWTAGLPGGDGTVIKAMYHPAGGRWSDPVVVSQRGRTALSPAVAVDAAGTATVVWENGNSKQLYLAKRTAKRGWGESRLFRETTFSHIAYPSVAAGNRGRFTISWSEWSIDEDDDDWPYGYASVYAATKPQDQPWGKPEVLRSLSRDVHLAPVLAMRDTGAATVAWSEGVDGTQTVQARTFSADTRTWNPIVTLATTSDDLSHVALAYGGNRVVAAWIDLGPTDDLGRGINTLHAATRSARGSWSAAEPLDTYVGSRAYYQPRVGASHAGAAVAWMRHPADHQYELVVVHAPPESEWGEPEVVAHAANEFGPRDATEPTPSNLPILFDREGRAVLTWVAVDGAGDDQWRMSRRSEGGVWSTPERFGPRTKNIFAGAVGMSPSGRPFAGWVVYRAHPHPSNRVVFLPRV